MGERRHKVKKIPASERGKSIMGPVVRIVFAVFLVGGAVAAAQVAAKLLRDVLSPGGAVPAAYDLVYLIVSVLAASLTYRAYVRVVEKRSVTELSAARAPRELGSARLSAWGWWLRSSGSCGCSATTGSRA
jgi:hypothetical protein